MCNRVICGSFTKFFSIIKEESTYNDINSKTNKKANQDLEQNALNELLKKHDVSFITKQMILEEVKKNINDRRIASINKRKELLNKEKLELKKNKKIYKNINPKDAYTIETQLMDKILK